jgi:hypothetical protein
LAAGILSGFVASLGRPVAPDLDAALERRRAHDRGVLERAIAADPPHTYRGCPAQAWSVASVLEAWWCLERVKSSGS